MLSLIRLTVVAQGMGYALQLLAIFVFAKTLGAENQGKLAAYRALGQISASLLWFGLPGAIVYLLGRERNVAKSLILNSVKWFTTAYVIFFLTLHFFPIERYISRFTLIQPDLNLFSGFVFFSALFVLLQAIALGTKSYTTFNLMSLISGLIICSFALYHPTFDEGGSLLRWAMAGYTMAYMGGATFAYLRLRKDESLSEDAGTAASIVHQLKVGGRAFLSSFGALLLFRVDLLLVGYFLGVGAVGVYSIALFSAEIITKVPYWSASILTDPSIAEM